jgi:hypothetical protein
MSKLIPMKVTDLDKKTREKKNFPGRTVNHRIKTASCLNASFFVYTHLISKSRQFWCVYSMLVDLAKKKKEKNEEIEKKKADFFFC